MLLNPIRPWKNIARRESRAISVGSVRVGGGAPISVQTMTNTPTTDVEATSVQISECVEAGANIVRVSVPDEDSSKALKKIVDKSEVPIVADIHFHYRRAIESADAGAACIRINPGNIGSRERIKSVVSAASANGCSIRIGVNAGSLEKHLLEKYREPCPQAMVESGLENIRALEDMNFFEFKISCKASDVMLAIAAYRGLAEVTDAPIHLGITEAGGAYSGTVKSAIGIGSLLHSGIGDTLRVSLSADPAEEVRAGNEILKSLGLLKRGVNIIACPSCARQGFDVIETVAILEEKLQHIKMPLDLSIIGCVVNGPGEALMTDIGFAGGGKNAGMLYLSGETAAKLSNDKLVERVVFEVEKRARELELAAEGPSNSFSLP